MLMATEETEDSLPPLDPSIAPVLLFDDDYHDDNDDSGADETSHVRYMYSIPKRRALRRKGLGSFTMNVNWVTPQGWVLTLENEDGSRDVSLRDPFSPRAVQLPQDREGYLDSDITRCVLSTHRPTDPGCVVLVTHQQDPLLFYCRPGDSRWSRHEYQPELICDDRHSAIRTISWLTAAGGRFYGHRSVDEKMLTLQFSPEPMLTVTHVAKTPWPSRCDVSIYHLVESCGELFLVQFYYMMPDLHKIMQVTVHKLDRYMCAWVKATNLGIDRVFLIGDSQFGVSMAAEVHSLKSNCIYFIKDAYKGLFVYDMEQGTTVLHDPGQKFSDSTDPIIFMPVQ